MACGIDIRWRHQKRGLDRQIWTTGRYVRDKWTTETMRDEDCPWPLLNSTHQAFHPAAQVGPVPFILLDACRGGKRLLQMSLPMIRPRSAEARNDENRSHVRILRAIVARR